MARPPKSRGTTPTISFCPRDRKSLPRGARGGGDPDIPTRWEEGPCYISVCGAGHLWRWPSLENKPCPTGMARRLKASTVGTETLGSGAERSEPLCSFSFVFRFRSSLLLVVYSLAKTKTKQNRRQQQNHLSSQDLCVISQGRTLIESAAHHPDRRKWPGE